MATEEEELLAQFDRKSAEAVAELAPDGEHYEAFNAVDRVQLSVYLCPVGEPLQYPAYRYLMTTIVMPSGKRLDLVFSFMVVTITGHNLDAIGYALSKNRCEFIKQYDAKKWPKPKDASAPFVEAIKYVMSIPLDPMEQK